MRARFPKNRLEAFTDGVLAIIITIMVLEMKVPHEAEHFADLKPVLPVFLSFAMSFVYLGIFWNNHHRMLHAHFCRVVALPGHALHGSRVDA